MMRGKLIQASELVAGNTFPVQTPTSGVEPRTVAEKPVIEDGVVMVSFTDGTAWAWEVGDPILLVGMED